MKLGDVHESDHRWIPLDGGGGWVVVVKKGFLSGWLLGWDLCVFQAEGDWAKDKPDWVQGTKKAWVWWI